MGDILSGIDLCFNPSNLGTPDDEGNYPLGFGLIERTTGNGTWLRVNGYSENVGKNTDFVITLYDLSGTVAQVDFVTVAWRPDASNPSTASNDSPFNSNDFDEMIRGKVLANSGSSATCGCGVGGNTPNGNTFVFGTYTLKNSGAYEVTVEARITVNGQSTTLKCDPKIIVGS